MCSCLAAVADTASLRRGHAGADGGAGRGGGCGRGRGRWNAPTRGVHCFGTRWWGGVAWRWVDVDRRARVETGAGRDGGGGRRVGGGVGDTPTRRVACAARVQRGGLLRLPRHGGCWVWLGDSLAALAWYGPPAVLSLFLFCVASPPPLVCPDRVPVACVGVAFRGAPESQPDTHQSTRAPARQAPERFVPSKGDPPISPGCSPPSSASLPRLLDTRRDLRRWYSGVRKCIVFTFFVTRGFRGRFKSASQQRDSLCLVVLHRFKRQRHVPLTTAATDAHE